MISPVLTVFTHVQRGAQEAMRLLRGFIVGFVAYGLFSLVIALTITRASTAASFAMAIAAALGAQALYLNGTVTGPGRRRYTAKKSRSSGTR
ncbi:MAG TPA: hypothetical protein VJP39_04945 [Gaiellaceae bacterium]|nr:hypothetical protein [Gaiellaceae bacterium]